MSADDILSMIVATIFFVMGIYFNHKVKQMSKDENYSNKKA